jgi:hypothetical protein
LAQGRVKALWQRSASHLDEGDDGGEKLIVALTMTGMLASASGVANVGSDTS